MFREAERNRTGINLNYITFIDKITNYKKILTPVYKISGFGQASAGTA